MPVIAFANPKGGSGKTTSALLLATELAGKGATVTVIDADPEQWIMKWAALPGRPDTLKAISNREEDGLVDAIEAAQAASQFVIVDLEGTANAMVTDAIGMADLVVIPIQGSAMDAQGGAKMLRLIRNQEKITKRTINYGMLLTRTSAAVMSRSLRDVVEQLRGSKVTLFSTPIVERAAFRDLFAYGGTLASMEAGQVSNLDKAVENAQAFAGEVLTALHIVKPSRKVA